MSDATEYADWLEAQRVAPPCACGGPCEHDGSLAEAIREQQRLHEEDPDVFAPVPPPAAEPPHELREAVARWLGGELRARPWEQWSEVARNIRRGRADDLLAGPLAPLLARLTRAEAAVRDLPDVCHLECGGGKPCHLCAPSPAAAGLPAEDVERVAERLHVVGTRPGFAEKPAWERWTELAAAALAEMRPTAAEESR